MQTAQDRRRAVQPETADTLAQMNEVAWEATDPQLLELCRRRLATLLDGAPDDIDLDALSARDRAFIAFTDQFVFSVASVTEGEVEALLAHADHLEVYRFVAALYTLEMTLRIEIAGRVVLAPEEVSA
ncbi:unannotated protein [freshwater metagenome]|uniref:Unannotated protein n=1 Tax=freshwater metagenome TaxID=449393 RepID=A0A6J7EF39_9ZZZZ|nr:hypothetical protein [Actinomycetota bacterium]